MEFVYPEIIENEIQFKRILPEDFEGPFRATLQTVAPNELGYISDAIEPLLRLEDKNTVVLNAGVGQGKTTLIINKIAHQCYTQGYLVVFIAPYLSLIKQYNQDLISSGIPSDQIVDFQNVTSDDEIAELIEKGKLQKEISTIEASRKSIHIMTVNALLGNPGDDAIKQSYIKTQYINQIIRRCKRENKQVVWILDEVHDSIVHFQQKLIFNLWKWRDVLHKTFTISATYNEASKIVLKYLAELTENELQVIEAARTKKEERSELYLVHYNKNSYDVFDEGLINLFEHLINKQKSIDIITYSRTLATLIVDSSKTDNTEVNSSNTKREEPIESIGKTLSKKFNLNLCVAGANNQFNDSLCNVGTNFSTGVNIEKLNSALVVFLPLSTTGIQGLGIFSGGINTIIQSLARQRKKGQIYIICPTPDFLIEHGEDAELLSASTQMKATESLEHLLIKQKYFDINNQKKLVEDIYFEVRRNIEEEISYIESIQDDRNSYPTPLPKLEFPKLEEYLLTEGEKALVFRYDIFGRNPSVYVHWAAFNDQFLNCKLKGIAKLNKLEIDENKAFEEINDFVLSKLYDFIPYYSDYSSRNNIFEFGSDLECYHTIRSAIYKHQVFLVDGEENMKRLSVVYKNPVIEKAILGVIQYRKKDSDYYCHYFFNNYIHFGSLEDWSKVTRTENVYSTKDYLLACLKNSIRDDIEIMTSAQQELKEAYANLYYFLIGFKEQFFLTDDNGKFFLNETVPPLQLFRENQFRNIADSIQLIRTKDMFVSSKVFGVFQSLKLEDTTNDLAKKIVKFFVNEFLEVSRERIQISKFELSDNRGKVLKKDIEFPQGQLLNFLFTSNNYWNESKINSYSIN